MVERDDLVAATREVEGHAPRPRTELQDRAAGRGGQLAPEREVGDVAAAFEVVPDDGLGLAHHAAGTRTRTARGRTRRVTGSSPIGSPSAYMVNGRSAVTRTSCARSTCTVGRST